MKTKGNADDLKWVSLFSPSIIPRYLLNQIAKRDYDIDDLYKYLEINCLIQTPKGPTLNPFFRIQVLADLENMIKGFLWFTVDPLTKDIVIQIYSVDNHYWGNKSAVLKLSEHLKDIRKKANLNKIFWITKFPKHSAKFGFKPSKDVLMEYKEEEDGKDSNGRI